MKKIYLGEQDKENIISEYIKNNDITKVFVIGDDLDIEKNDFIPFKETIMYKWFYPLLQTIDKNTLIVLNECLKKKFTSCLEYNCIRHYLENTKHTLVFNYYPIIDEEEDFMILYSFIQINPFMKDKYKYITKFENVEVGEINTNFTKTDLKVDDKFKTEYENLKEKTISQVKKDPDIIPRRLLKLSEKYNKKFVKEFDSLTERKPNMNIVVNDSNVDKYFYGQLLKWKESVEDVSSKVSKG